MALFSFIKGILVSTAHAAGTSCSGASNIIECYCQSLHPGCGSGTAYIAQIANQTVDVISDFIGGVAVLAFIWGAVRMAASGGNEEGKTAGRNIMIGAVVGIVLALMGKALVLFVNSFILAVPGFT